MMKHLEHLGIPQILIGRDYCPFDYVTTDARTGILEGLRWLRQASGASDITFLSQTADSERPYLAERQIAFYEAAAELGCFPGPGGVLVPSFDNLSRVVNDLGRKLFQSENCPRAIFLTQFQAALPLISYAMGSGCEPGRHFHLLVFDEERMLLPYPGIAMLKQRWDLMRMEAIRWVSRLREGNPERVRLRIPPELNVCGENNDLKT
jgi:DNA-binding LacI/PurR family transcriptional regulator